MSEPVSETSEPPRAPDLPEASRGDRDIDLKALYAFAGGLAGIVVAVMALVWGLSIHLKSELAASDPEPSPLPEAQVHRLPPEPRLEEAPAKNLAELRAREEAVLRSWAWIDKERGLARIPIERAMEIAAEKGLPAPAAPQGSPEEEKK